LAVDGPHSTAFTDELELVVRGKMNAAQILFKTHRFNLSKEGEHFINPCCFGEDLAGWLRTKLIERSVEVHQVYQEDWGWELPVACGNDLYYLCMCGNSDELNTNPDEGERRIIIEKRRTIGQRLSDAGKLTANDEMAKTIEEILSGEPTVRELRREE
jgi:hypothetical protein